MILRYEGPTPAEASLTFTVARRGENAVPTADEWEPWDDFRDEPAN